MPIFRPVQEKDVKGKVREVFEEIKSARKIKESQLCLIESGSNS